MSLESFVRRVLGDYRFERVYPATVERYSSGAVDVIPDDESIRGLGMQKLTVRVGVPSASVSVEPGARCLVAFAEGDQRRPYVCAWEYKRASAVVFLDGGDAGVARHGDLVDVLLGALATPIAGVVGGSYTIPGSPPTVVEIPEGTPFVGTATVATPVRAVVIGGARRVTA